MDGVSRTSLASALAGFEQQYAADPSVAADVSSGLGGVLGVLDAQHSLRRALTDPASQPEGRRGLVAAIFGGKLPAAAETALDVLVTQAWSRPTDLRTAVERVADVAALAAVETSGDLDDVEDELFRFARLLEREPALRRALVDPGTPADRKRGLVQTLLQGRARPATVSLVADAVLRPRTTSLEVALEGLSVLAAERRQRLVAAVRVARPLDQAQTERLSAVLARVYGREVALQVDVDPSVLGGVEVVVGDEVLDGTVARRLERARQALTR